MVAGWASGFRTWSGCEVVVVVMCDRCWQDLGIEAGALLGSAHVRQPTMSQFSPPLHPPLARTPSEITHAPTSRFFPFWKKVWPTFEQILAAGSSFDDGV